MRKRLIQSGITRVVGHQLMLDKTPPHWKESIEAAFKMLEESGVKMELVQEPLPQAPMIRFNGELWQP